MHHPRVADWNTSCSVRLRPASFELLSTTEMPRLYLPPIVLCLRLLFSSADVVPCRGVPYLFVPGHGIVGYTILSSVIREVLDQPGKHILEFLA